MKILNDIKVFINKYIRLFDIINLANVIVALSIDHKMSGTVVYLVTIYAIIRYMEIRLYYDNDTRPSGKWYDIL